jgi:hypothetical protein
MVCNCFFKTSVYDPVSTKNIFRGEKAAGSWRLQLTHVYICARAISFHGELSWKKINSLLSFKSRDNSVGIVLGYGLDDRGSRVRFPAGTGNFLFTIASRTALGPTQPPIQWVPGALSVGAKRPGREADHSPPSSAEVKNTWSYNSIPQYVFMAWCLIKQMICLHGTTLLLDLCVFRFQQWRG